MKRCLIAALSILGWSLVLEPAAHAADHTWVATNGKNTNPCSRNAPCRSIARALTRTGPGGTITVLNSGSYGPAVTITQAVSIVADGVSADISPGAGNQTAIRVQAGSSDVVVLRGLKLLAGSEGSEGIAFVSGEELQLQDVEISGFSFVGVFAEGVGRLVVKDTTVRNGGVAFRVESGHAFLDRVDVLNAIQGVYVTGGAKVVARGVSVSGTGDAAFRAFSNNASHHTELTLESCVATGNLYGLVTEGAAGTTTVRLSGCTIASNFSVGISQSGATVVETRGNNTIRGNSPNLTGTLTPVGGS